MMRQHEVRDIMTADPFTVTPATPLRYVTSSLVKHKISAVPVLSLQGKVLGVISEADLLRRKELQRDPGGEHSSHLTYRARRDMATAETAGELVSEHPATVRPDATVAEAARLMDRYEVTCLPVIDDGGKLLGVVGLLDLLRAFLRSAGEVKAPTCAPGHDEPPTTRDTHPPWASRPLA
jgi:CBS domain-containing protein